MLKCHFGTRHCSPLLLMVALSLASSGTAQAQSEIELSACPLQRSSDEWDRCIGVWNTPEGDTVYSGEFGGGTFDGYGVLFIGRSRYSGQFRQGRMHGQGVLLWDDGQMYVGGFEEGVIAGVGRLLAADGREVFAGQFVDGAPVPDETATTAPPVAAPAQQADGEFRVGDAVEVMSNGFWFPAHVKAVNGPGEWLIGYDRYSDSWDEVVGRDRIRARGSEATTAAGQAGGQPPAQDEPSTAAQAAAGGWPATPVGAEMPIDGVFLTVRSWMSGSVDMEAWFFTRNGRFSRSPRGGISLQALATQRAPGEAEGTYWIEDGELVLAWSDGREPWRSPYNADPNALVIGTQFASKWSGFPKGWRLDGAYQGGASIGGGALSSSSMLVFRSDGSYSRQAVVNMSSEGRSSSLSSGGMGEATGTYEFDEFSLTLRENGTEVTYTVFGYGERDAEGRPEQLFWERLLMSRLN